MNTESIQRWRQNGPKWGPMAVGAAFAVSGVVHLIKPSIFTPLIPGALPGPTAIVYVSGVAELVVAAGLFTRQRWAGPAAAGLLLVVWPGNWSYAIAATAENGLSSPQAIIGWLRLPLQIPLIWWALQDPERSRRVESAAP